MDIKVPAVGESVYEGLLVKWHRKDGDLVQRDEPLCEIETDKITIELNAEADGRLTIRAREGKTVKIGSIIGTIDETAAKGAPEKEAGKKGEKPAAGLPEGPTSPAARRIAREHAIKAEEVEGTGKGGRVTAEDLQRLIRTEKPQEVKTSPAPVKAAAPEEVSPETSEPAGKEGRITRKPMTPIRRRIAERLLAARQQTAMLTTFNEVDMSRVIALRNKHRDDFERKHGVRLGYMSFFVRASVEALQDFPEVNAWIEGDDIVYHNYYDIGIAIGGEKGLVVPVIRNADRLHFAEIEKAIDGFVNKVKTNKLEIADLEGGTFSITNGGVFGSLLSTPMLNPPQSGILGMHAIQDRPVVRDGKIVVKPMMYLALTYDHRIIDGRQAIGFLKRIKELVEEPEEMLLEA